ncbi:FLC1 [[Candida] subhashii]|uniref:FLC1 n=1 Tax=[Candida] subhashii TaxID=561895 RepID=A0A8J5UMD6_9ASCO|nr:FLC1 [[Candida] subhashii]KAG7663241.1 FLC1 [[Candida] subhashii]
MLLNLSKLLLLVIAITTTTNAQRLLSANSLVQCMDNSQISPSYFNVTFNPDDRSLRYNLDLTSSLNTYVTAHVEVYAYGFLIIEKDIDLCSLGWKQFCPVYPGPLQVDSIEYISKEYADQIPGIAYEVPDIDAVVKVLVLDQSTGEQLSCIQSSFTNGKTISQTGVKWATAVVAGLGLLIAAILSTFGNSNAASHIAANSISLFLYFQSVVVVSMQAVERVPPIASSWSENLAWSMGLIRIEFMQDIFRWYIQATGGKPTTYLKGVVQQILVQKRGLERFAKRSLDYALQSNKTLIVLRGIERIGYNSKIEPTSIVVTGYTFFILVGYLLVVVLVLAKSAIILLKRFNKINRSFSMFNTGFNHLLKGSVLRYICIGLTQLTIFSFWEFTKQDSPAVIVLAVLFLLLLAAVLSWSYYNVLKYARESKKKFDNPAALLYGDANILNKFGFCYTMFRAEKYYFGLVQIAHILLKSIFIAFTQSAGKVSVFPVFIFDLAYTIYLIYEGPYLNKPTNITNYMIAIVTTINSFLFLFFSDIFGQPASVGSIMGWIFFILNAGFSLVLLLLIITFIVLSVISKNPDARFAPVRDDRFSFQRKSSIKRTEKRDSSNGEASSSGANEENELAALGIAAQDHALDWEREMYKLNNVSTGYISPHIDDEIEMEENKGLGSRLKDKIVRKLSKRGRSERPVSGVRMSETLVNKENEPQDIEILERHESSGSSDIEKSPARLI